MISLTVTEISEGFWQINEANENGPYVDAYLLFGTKRALLIDTLMYAKDLYEKVREITPLPLDVIITHGHGDHAGISIEEFYKAGCNIYMDARDVPILKEMFNHPAEASWFTHIEDGHIFELGEKRLEVISVPGHSPGSVVLLDKENEIIFTGDAIGSTHFWMHIPTSLPLDIFCGNLQRLYDNTKDYKNLLVYPGHLTQSLAPLTSQYIEDTLTITKNLLSGVFVGDDATTDFFGPPMSYKHISYGTMTDYLYSPQNMFSKPSK